MGLTLIPTLVGRRASLQGDGTDLASARAATAAAVAAELAAVTRTWVRIDANGNQLWDRSFGGSGLYDWAYNVKATSDGGVIVMGESDSDIDGNKTTAHKRISLK